MTDEQTQGQEPNDVPAIIAEALGVAAAQWTQPTDIDIVRDVLCKAHGQQWANASYGWMQLANGQELYVGILIDLVVEGEFFRGFSLNFHFVEWDKETMQWVLHPMLMTNGEQEWQV